MVGSPLRRMLCAVLALAACSPAPQPAAPAPADTEVGGARAEPDAPASQDAATAHGIRPAPPTTADDTRAIADAAPTRTAMPLAPAPTAPGRTPSAAGTVGFRCIGWEPAWTLAVADGGGELAVDDMVQGFAGDLKVTAGGAWTWLGLPGDDPAASIALLLAPGQCFPPGGGPAWPYLAELGLADGRQLTGCCRPAARDTPDP